MCMHTHPHPLPPTKRLEARRASFAARFDAAEAWELKDGSDETMYVCVVCVYV